MGLLGDTSKGILLLAVVVGIFLIFKFMEMNQIALAILILIGLIIPFSLVAFEYRRNHQEFQSTKCRHDFNVSHLRLLFTMRFLGKGQSTATAAYHLKCPQCGDKSWIVPSE